MGHCHVTLALQSYYKLLHDTHLLQSIDNIKGIYGGYIAHCRAHETYPVIIIRR